MRRAIGLLVAQVNNGNKKFIVFGMASRPCLRKHCFTPEIVLKVHCKWPRAHFVAFNCMAKAI